MPLSYATREDVLARYQADVVERICFDNDTDEADLDKLDRALEDAAAEIDSYVSTRYPVPVNPVPLILRNMNVAGGLYWGALTADKLFEELARRAENWRRHLIMIAKGTAGLGVREDSSPSDPSPAEGTGFGTGMVVRSKGVLAMAGVFDGKVVGLARVDRMMAQLANFGGSKMSLLRALGVLIQKQHIRRVLSEKTSPDGAAWTPIKASTVERKGNANILVESGRMAHAWSLAF